MVSSNVMWDAMCLVQDVGNAELGVWEQFVCERVT